MRLRIREIATAKGFNVQRLSLAANLTYKTVEELWKEKKDNTTTKTLEAIAQALDCKIADLIDEDDA